MSYVLSFFFTFLIKKIKVIGTISQICSFLLLIFNFQKFIFSFNIFKWAIYSDLDVDPWLKISVSSNPDPQLWHYFASEFRRVAPGTGRAWRGQWGWSPQWPGWRCTCWSQCACVWIVKNYLFGLTKLILKARFPVRSLEVHKEHVMNSLIIFSTEPTLSVFLKLIFF